MSTDILMVFTNITSLNLLLKKIGSGERADDIPGLTTISEHKVIKYDDEQGFIPQEGAIVEGGLYFVFDEIPLSSADPIERPLQSFLPESRDQLYVLKHSLPNRYEFSSESDDDENVKVARSEVGQHEADGDYFPQIVEILLDTDAGKPARIAEAVFPRYLRERLNLLHQCLIPSKAPKFSDFPQPLRSKYFEGYKNFWKAVGGNEKGDEPLAREDPFDETYVRELSKLRDGILA